MSWNKIYFNSMNIDKETDKAILIKAPKNSKYEDYKFWVPRKFVHTLRAGKGYYSCLNFPDEYEFQLKKYGKNFQVTASVVLGKDEILELYKTADEGIRSSVTKFYTSDKNTKYYYEETEPEKVEIKEREIPSDLMR